VPFREANLKLVYEELRQRGVPLSASEVGRLFRQGQLDEVLAAARQRLGAIRTTRETIARLEEVRAQPDLSPGMLLAILGQLEAAKSRLEELLPFEDRTETWN